MKLNLILLFFSVMMDDGDVKIIMIFIKSMKS